MSQFINKAAQFGINHLFIGGGYGGGVSLVDINGDGLDDLTLATGAGQPLQIYLQSTDGLELVLDPLIISITQPVRSITWVDYDNDGDKDLFFTTAEVSQSAGKFKLYRQDESMQFTNVTLESGINPDYAYSFGTSWADYDKDGFLDLYVNTRTIGANGANYLYHNLGDGSFEEVAEQLGVQDHQGHSFTSIFFDADLDGNVDLFTANDRTNSFNRFYLGIPDGTFIDYSVESNLHICMDAMGAEFGDYDNDGDFDIYVTNTSGGALDSLVGNLMFRNEGDLQFTALSNFPFGVDIGSFWGCNFIDIDFDRDLDLFTVATWTDLPNATNMLMFNNTGDGLYAAYGGTEFNGNSGYHFASAQGDLNNDGWTDLVVGNQYTSNSKVYMATPGMNNWIKLHLKGTVSNADAIGSLIEVWSNGVRRIDMTSCGNSYITQDSDTYPFGLGEAVKADSVIIHWPNGHVNAIYDLPAGARYEIVEDLSTYVIHLDSGCNEAFSAPVDLWDTFKPVEGQFDRVQLYWLKESPSLKFSDEDAAACDIKFWPKWHLDPFSGQLVGDMIQNPDTNLILDAKKFYPDGSPRSIYKWPVKFMETGASSSRRAMPNLRYEWQVRCACDHGSGPESEWSAIGNFNTPDFNIESGLFEGILPSDDDPNQAKSMFVASALEFEISPNPIRGEEIRLRLSDAIEEVGEYRIRDLLGRELETGRCVLSGEGQVIIRPNIELTDCTYFLELEMDSKVISSRFIVLNN